MKIGLIVECTRDGPDQQVYSAWIKRLLPDAQLEPSCAGSKKILVAEAGERAAALFGEGCERVLIFWDLWPTWKSGAKPDAATDVAAIEASLRAAGLNEPCVFLICIVRMIETLLIADANAVRGALGRHAPFGLRSQRRPRTIADPKAYLTRLFREARRGPYTDYVHARKIAEGMDFDRLRPACPEFAQLEQSLTQSPCRPPLAWQP